MIQLLWTILTLAVLLKAAALIILGVLGTTFVRKMDGILDKIAELPPVLRGISYILDREGKVKIFDEQIKNLRFLAQRPKHDEAPADLDSYKAGLEDGSTTLAEYILSELKEDTDG